MDHNVVSNDESSFEPRKHRRRYVGFFRRRLKQSSDSSGRTLSSDCSGSLEPKSITTTNVSSISILKYPTQSVSLAHDIEQERQSNHCKEPDEEEGEEEEPAVDTLDSPSSRGRCKQVSFGNLTTSFHEIILGDNPAVSSGLPITIDWTPFEEVKESIEEHEQQKEKESSSGWRSEAVVLPPTVRKSLIEPVTTLEERNEMSRLVGEIQKSRLLAANAGIAAIQTEQNWQWKTLFKRSENKKKKSHLNWIRE